MRKIALSVVALFALFLATNLYAAESGSQDQTPATASTTAESKTASDSATPAPITVNTIGTDTATVAAPVAESENGSENLEFVSGEVTAIDETAKTVTVKLYGETEKSQSDKVISVKVDDSTDITDGEADRALKSLTAGTEVDVEYDPATNVATYIFVY